MAAVVEQLPALGLPERHAGIGFPGHIGLGHRLAVIRDGSFVICAQPQAFGRSLQRLPAGLCRVYLH